MSAIDRETSIPRVARSLPNPVHGRLIEAAVRDGVLSETVAYGLMDRQACGMLRPDELEAVVALARLKGRDHVDRRFAEGGIAAFRRAGEIEDLGRTLASEARRIEQAARGNAEVQVRMTKDLFIRTFGKTW